ncbi:Leucine-rich repeat receptor-like tyrosine-protein kinase [Acorus gramineus]|uniref:Leucine-rich repeat receptor-like tyrosine-protein kinase n=1 Tax=Acorus gramineus TaxID=55184 RepID=A0AAV9B707_ACOGR|nr:Leucine-rich repeat receptor-like tyrosine-protein kinase [Acorus gramineus]
MQVTAPGNVYSYGVVLLEILTSRLPVDEAFGEGIDLVKWVHGAWGRGETPEQIMDSRLSTVSFAWRRQMLGVLKVAMSCTETMPAKRPKMKKVVEMLLGIFNTLYDFFSILYFLSGLTKHNIHKISPPSQPPLHVRSPSPPPYLRPPPPLRSASLNGDHPQPAATPITPSPVQFIFII